MSASSNSYDAAEPFRAAPASSSKPIPLPSFETPPVRRNSGQATLVQAVNAERGKVSLPPPILPPSQAKTNVFIGAVDAKKKTDRSIKAWIGGRMLATAPKMPAWMTSFIVHLGILLLLALIPIIIEPKSLFTLTLDSTDAELGEADSEFSLSGAPPSLETMAADAITLPTTAELEFKAISELGPALPDTISTSTAPPAISMGLTGRNGLLKETLLGEYGGTGKTEEAVARGLAWLARKQQRDGSWSLKRGISDGGSYDDKTAATAMALIAFAGAGNTQFEGQYSEVVAKGLEKLVSWQAEDGSFVADGTKYRNAAGYAHAQATIALCELFGMTHDLTLKRRAQAAVDFASIWQDPKDGGWRYEPREDSDLSVSGWFLMSIMSARMAGLSTNSSTLSKFDGYLDKVSHEKGSQYSYVSYSKPDHVMTAEGLLCRLYRGWTRTDSRVRGGVKVLLQHPITVDRNDRDYYFWYYATQTMHHMGGSDWSQWNEKMREALPDLQQSVGPEAGSWSPSGDQHGSIGGRLYATCFSLYCLEVYYRHLPLYK